MAPLRGATSITSGERACERNLGLRETGACAGELASVTWGLDKQLNK